VTALLASLVGAAAILIWRIHETTRPVTERTIVLPPLGMSTGFSMFLLPGFRVPWPWAAGAFVAGAVLLGYPLIKSSRLTRDNGRIMMQRSRAFLAILLALVAVRILLRDYVGHILPARQTAALFFILAFGMIVRWRVWMLREYRQLARKSNGD
jgi:membrane protein CcdC involved in cytochrome C biogenesis